MSGSTPRVLVTGATGYVGRRVVPRLLDGGYAVRALTRDPPAAAARAPADVELVRGDVTDPASLGPALDGVDVVVHLAAVTADQKPPPGGYDAVNADGAANLGRAAAAAGVRRLVQMGGIDTAGDRPSAYLAGRRRGEQAVRDSGVPHVLLRPSVMFGGADAPFFAALAGLVRLAPVVPVPGDGRTRFQPIHVDDVAAATAAAVAGAGEPGAYPLGGADVLTYDEVLDLIGSALGRSRVRKVHVPVALVRLQAIPLQLLPHPPVTPAALDLFASDNVAEPNELEHTFGVTPRSVREHLRQHGLERG